MLNDAVLIVVTAYAFPRAVLSMDGTTYFDIHDAEATARNVQTVLIESELHVDLPDRHIHQMVAYGTPVVALVAESSEADLLVVGRRAGRIRRLLTGSVSKGCVNQAACPVVVVRTEPPAARTLGPIIGRHVRQLTEAIPDADMPTRPDPRSRWRRLLRVADVCRSPHRRRRGRAVGRYDEWPIMLPFDPTT